MNRFILWFIKLTGWPMEYVYYRKKVYYEDPACQKRRIKGGALIVSNHTSVYDYPLIMYTFMGRCIRPLVAEVIYQKGKFMSRLMKNMGAIRVDRDAYDFSFMSTMVKCLENKQVGLVFPEARIGKEEEKTDGMLDFKPSFAYMALEAGVPIIPVYTNGVYGKAKKSKRDRARIIIGKKIYLDELYDRTKSEKENIDYLCNYVRTYIKHLKNVLEEKTKDEKK
ncbi:MAG: 1-acyl-sn-glycerol-3-phosphate acyltransferase [Clostridiales bacterium]|nr:1-acyl-sn-glycerol-3-phosphate acyltransferase [Clostridiales bacterium]